MSDQQIAVIQQSGAELFRQSTDAAGLCKAIVLATAKPIQGRKFVGVEGWQAIAIAHGCTASSGDVRKTEDGGYAAIGRIIRMDTGATIATAEGYIGPDEPVWFGGGTNPKTGKPYVKRPDYAIRAMAQTRAISRACRSAFAHVVVMMNAGLSTTPAEEVPPGGFDDEPRQHRAPHADAPVDTVTGEIVTDPSNEAKRDYLDAIAKAADMNALKAFYDGAVKLAKDTGDKAYKAEVVAAKDKRKAELTAATQDWVAAYDGKTPTTEDVPQ